MRRCLLYSVLCGLTLLLAGHESYSAETEPCTAAYDVAVSALATSAPAQVWTLVESERQSGCVLGATDTTGIKKLYLDLQMAKSDGERAVLRAQLFDRVLAQFDGFAANSCAGETTPCVVGRQRQAIEQVRDLLVNGQPDQTDAMLTNGSWAAVIRDGAIGASGVRLQPYLENECGEGAKSSRCRAAVDVAAKVLRSSEATFQAIVAHRLPIIAANAMFLTTRDREWNAYFNDTSVQYPWELALNGRRFRKDHPDPAVRGQFPRAPAQRVILLHPAPGFEYAKTGSGRGTQAAVVVEVLGYERWRWREGSAINRVGVSLAASFSDVPGADKVGYGLVFHLPVRNISLGAIWRDGVAGGKVNIVMNADLAGLIKQYRDVDVRDFLNP